MQQSYADLAISRQDVSRDLDQQIEEIKIGTTTTVESIETEIQKHMMPAVSLPLPKQQSHNEDSNLENQSNFSKPYKSSRPRNRRENLANKKQKQKDIKTFDSELIRVSPVKITQVSPTKRRINSTDDDNEYDEELENKDNYQSNQQSDEERNKNHEQLQKIDLDNKKNRQYTKQTKQSGNLDFREDESEYSESQEEQEEYDMRNPRMAKTDYSHRSDVEHEKRVFKAGSLQQLVYTPVLKTFAVKCLIRVQKSFLSGDVYDFYLEEDKKHLLRAVKSPVPLLGNFDFFDPSKKHKIAEMHKNFTGTEYVLYQKAKKLSSIQGKEGYITQSTWISYIPNLFGFSGQRDINILKRLRAVPRTDRFSDLKSCWEEGDRTRVQMLRHRMAEKRNGTYELDFRGVVKMPSTKNTIIEDEEGNQCIIFGKRSDEIYALHVSHPLSLIQAFAMGISNIDGKLLVH